MKKVPFLILFLFSIASSVLGKSILIKGNAPSYAHDTLIVFAFKENIINTKEVLANIPVNSDGSFSQTVNLNSSRPLYIDLYSYWGLLYAEPDLSYILNLPPRKELKIPQLLDPYFQPRILFIGKNENSSLDLNQKIPQFEALFNDKLKLLMQNYTNPNLIRITEEQIKNMDTTYPSDQGTYFNTYKKFRQAMLYSLASKTRQKRVIDKYFSHESPAYYNPSFWDIFNQVFDNLFTRHPASLCGQEWSKALVKNDIKTVVKILDQHFPIANKEMKELVLLKSFYDLYNQAKMPPKKVLSMISSFSQTLNHPKTQEMAQLLLHEISWLSPGSTPPDLKLKDKNNLPFSLNKTKGKVTYLYFFNPRIHQCLMDMEILQRVRLTYPGQFEVIAIMMYESPELFSKFSKSYKYPFIVLQGTPHLKADWRIKNIPWCILLDREGNVHQAPAKSPEENLEITLKQLLQN